MKHLFNTIMLFVIAATIGAVIFFLKPTFSKEENSALLPATKAIIENLIPQEKNNVVTFPYSTFSSSTVSQLEGAASSSKKVIADLNAMKIYLYTDNTLEKEIDIKSRGRSSTFWETPPGAYKIESHEQNHFSSIGHVWMPYSMHFFGNYFIHGWPYYEDGTPVGEGYSGGCIRLTTEDAKVVYDFTDKKTPLYIFGITSQVESKQEITQVDYKKTSTKQSLTATSYSIVDLTSGNIVDQKNEAEEINIGELTHFMTAVISLELLNQYSVVTISDIEAKSTLESGADIEALNLLYPLIFSHDLRAADTIINRTAPSWFVKNMNMKAQAIGMKSTTFKDALGIKENISTATDLIIFTNYLFNHKSYLTTLTTSPHKETEYGTWTNETPLLGKEYFKGGLVSSNNDNSYSAMLILKKNGANYGVVLLNSKDIQKDVEGILMKLS